MGLRPRQQAFVDAYLQSWNATDAARKAGYSEKTARAIGCENLTKPDIRAEIERRISESALKTGEVLLRLAAIARGDIGQFFKVIERETEDPLATDEVVGVRQITRLGQTVLIYTVRSTVLDREKLHDPALSMLVRKFSDSPKNGMSLELYDAQAALAMLGKALGVLRENVRLDHLDTLEVSTRVVYVRDDETYRDLGPAEVEVETA